MLSLALLVLNASSVCVPSSKVCAPAGSTVAGQIGPQGGQVTVTPAAPMKALGAEFRPGTPVVVTVAPWGGSSRGSIVHVSGELTKETTISGVRVAGTVRIGEIEGTLNGLPSTPQLVTATDIRGGAYQVGTTGTVDVGPGTRIAGNVDIGGVYLDITSDKPIHALGLDLTAGTLRIEQRAGGITIGGTLVRPQSVGGVLVDKQIYATLHGKGAVFANATLAGATQLRALGLPDGEAPGGTVVRSMPSQTELVGPGPFTICGIALVPGAVQPPALTVTLFGDETTINGVLAAPDVEVETDLHMTGAITLRYTTATCTRRGLDGTLARPALRHGLHFAAKPYAEGGATKDSEPILRGVLETTAVVDGLTLTGALMVRVPATTDVHLLDGILAKPARFEAWNVPAKTHVQRFGTGWSFEVPHGQSASAVADHHGERVSDVIEARSDDSSTTFTLRHPHTPKGTKLALASIGIMHDTGCVLGDLATQQAFGIFTIPKGGNVTLCNGTLTAAEGTYAVASLQVGRWFATSAIAGAPNAPPPQAGPDDKSLIGPPPSPPAAASKAVTGYWIQINSLCQGAAGIPLPPPSQRWIWVDLKGNASTSADRKELAADASKRGQPCPTVPCCPP